MKRIIVRIALILAIGAVFPTKLRAQDSGGRYLSCSASYTSTESFSRGGHLWTPKSDTKGDTEVCIGTDNVPYLLAYRDGVTTALYMVSLAGVPIQY